MLEKAVQQGRSERSGEGTLRYVEPLSAARTPLADFFNILPVFGKDKRTIADVILPDGTNVNHTLVKDGWCWWYRKYAPGDQELEHLEAEVREGKKGLWRDRSGTYTVATPSAITIAALQKDPWTSWPCLRL